MTDQKQTTRPRARSGTFPKRWRPLLRLRARSNVTALTIQPLDAVVLALDSAKHTGLATYYCGRLVGYGECDSRKPDERAEAIRSALRLAEYTGLKAGLALETPYGGALTTLLSLNATATLWRDSWVAHDQPLTRIVELQARQWRAQLFGSSRMPREATRRLEAITAAQIAQRDDVRDCGPIGPDAAAAICLGNVARRSAALLAALDCGLVGPDKSTRPSVRRT